MTADSIDQWPRERVEAAVKYARDLWAIPTSPLSPNVDRWDEITRELVIIADGMRHRKPFKEQHNGT